MYNSSFQSILQIKIFKTKFTRKIQNIQCIDYTHSKIILHNVNNQKKLHNSPNKNIIIIKVPICITHM